MTFNKALDTDRRKRFALRRERGRRADAVRKSQSRALFEASIMIEDKKTFPRITIDGRERHARHEWLSFIT